MRLLFIAVMLRSFAAQPQNTKTSEWYRIDSLFKNIYTNDKPGAAIAIEQKGKIVFKGGYGVANIETKKNITSRTNFNIGSVTKQFTAMAILQLAEDRELSLDDKLNKFFPELNKKVAEAVTVRELLTHSSGIVEHYDFTDTNKVRHAHNADVLNAIKNVDSTYFPPGTRYRYSNTAYCLLAVIIQKVSGMPYSAYLKKNIFQPLGMKNTTVWSENGSIINKATGYEFDTASGGFKRSGANENIFFSTEGDGGIYTSVDDYLEWLNAIQTRNLLSRANIDLARSPHFPVDTSKKISYGYGWFIREDSPPHKIYHSGSNGGFRAFVYTIPQEGYAIIIFSNRTGIDLESLVLEINKILRHGPWLPGRQ